MTETLLEQLEATLRQAIKYNENAEVAPVALLWPDRDGQFTEAARLLRSRLPLLMLGDRVNSQAQGPSCWLRCVIAGTVEIDLPEGIPVVYLPGVGRDDLRAVELCPYEIAPIAELQYRAEWFAHPNGKDWTVRALLTNRERGLGLDVADDAVTSQALRGAFGELLVLPMRRLTGRYIDADFLHGVLNPDQIGSLLEWLDDPTGFQARVDEGRWRAFVEQSKADYDLDPSTQGELTAARLLGERQGAWIDVWRTFEQYPERYPGIEERLRRGKPNLFAGSPDAWPQDNEADESRLRDTLTGLVGTPPGAARGAVNKLWGEHRERRNWVWAKLDRSPLVFALEHLHGLAEAARGGPNGTIADLAATYAATGWQADDAFLAALQAAPDSQDRAAVAGAATALYLPWLDAHAKALQEAIGPLANAGEYTPGPEASTDDGTVTVFVDGLRLDLGHRLARRLGSLRATVDTALAALPTVTGTAKPVLTPVPEETLGAGDGLVPTRASSGAKASVAVLRSLMADRGVEVLQGAETGDPSGCAWTECGDIDARGHSFQAAFVDEIDAELDRIARRVQLLLDAGWNQVDIVTDHGWLLLPGGLEKVELPAVTVEVKKGRCARLKDGASVSVPTIPWHWDRNVRIALAPGVSCFEANKEYEHGGVSLQECVVPRIRVRAAEMAVITGGGTITKIKWLGLMCRIEFENIPAGATVDIRALPGDGSTSVANEGRETAGAGKASLFVEDEELQGEPAFVVIIGSDGQILAQRAVTIGANR